MTDISQFTDQSLWIDPIPEYHLPPESFKNFSFETVKGEKENSSWLVVDKKYILHKNSSYRNGNTVWECKHRRARNCPFRLETEKDGDVIWMYDPKVHTCDPDPIEFLVHKFKLQVKEKMKSDFRAKYKIVYKSLKKQFLDAIEDPVYREMVSHQLPSDVSNHKCLNTNTFFLYDNIHAVTQNFL